MHVQLSFATSCFSEVLVVVAFVESYKGPIHSTKMQTGPTGKRGPPQKVNHFFETFPLGPNRSIEFWTEISGNFGWMDRALKSLRRRQRQSKRHPKSEFPLFQTSLLLICKNDGYFSQELNSKGLYLSPSQYLSSQKKKRKSLSCVHVLHKTWN